MQRFGIDYEGGPRMLPLELHNFRVEFMHEELTEYTAWVRTMHNPYVDQLPGVMCEQLDALVDLVYVAIGTARYHGFDFNEAWRRVHAANMAKVTQAEYALQFGPYPKAVRSPLDVVKPPGWTPPDHTDLVAITE